jgi:diguanylate cyclase (GGDEF)-like protein
MIQFDKRVLDLLQECILIWDKEGRKLISNNKVYPLYGLTEEDIKNCNDITGKWNFFDSEGKVLQLNDLPPYKAMKTNVPIRDITLKMVSDDVSKWITTSAIPVFDEFGAIEAIISTTLDISRLKSEEMMYKKIANYDPLTKLPNRLLLTDRLELAISHANRTKTGVAVCMIDLDGFKAINDTLGHDAGDQVLIEASKRMLRAVRADDTVARLGGDEFIVVLTDLSNNEECAISLYRLLTAIASPYMIGENEVSTISASIGVSFYPDDKVEPDILIRHADIAMYKSKNSGKNKFNFFDIAADQKIKANFNILNKIKKSIEKNEFCLYYQPKINVVSGQIVEVEALARWNHPLLGILSPSEFLPLVENDDDLSTLFNHWVIAQAITQLKQWQADGLYIKICINISPREFKQPEFMEKITKIFSDNQASLDLLSYLEFEILESAAVENLNKSNKIIKECKLLGINFALDDFGTGYSSLMHLKELNIDTIKIDRTFVSGMLDNSEDMAIVQAVIGLANAFDISVTAEGAENIEQVMSLMEIGCDDIQGYALARPMPQNAMKVFIDKFVPDPRWKLASQTLPSKAHFELLLAESNHKYWVDLVLHELENSQMDDALFHTNYTLCKFGKWFEKSKNKNYKKSPHFKEIETVHKQLHKKVQEIYLRLLRDKRRINEFEKEEILILSHHITLTLEKIRNDIEKIKHDSNVVNKILQKREFYGKQH